MTDKKWIEKESEYNTEQREALDLIVTGLSGMTHDEIDHLKKEAAAYLQFREEVKAFSESHLFLLCKKKCYDTGVSACCTKEGIITYFTDMVLNLLYADDHKIAQIRERLSRPQSNTQCVYLTETGCLWSIKPIICEMFFCDWLLDETALKDPSIAEQIGTYKTRQKWFTWPDKPVLFDTVEKTFLEKGITSSLMYYHFSPGLKKVKKKAGVP